MQNYNLSSKHKPYYQHLRKQLKQLRKQPDTATNRIRIYVCKRFLNQYAFYPLSIFLPKK